MLQANFYHVVDDEYKVNFLTPRHKQQPHIKVHSAVKLSSSLSRSRRLVHDLALCNDWEYFCTFTFADNRSDFQRCKSSLTKFFNNYKNRYQSDFRYLVIPEFHKDKQNFHFHGLISKCYGFSVPDTILKRSGGDLIEVPNTPGYYKWDAYKLGFFNASKIVNKEATAKYMTKYITKDLMSMQDFLHCQLVLHSKGLKKPELIASKIDDFDLSLLEPLKDKCTAFDYCLQYNKLSADDLFFIGDKLF